MDNSYDLLFKKIEDVLNTDLDSVILFENEDLDKIFKTRISNELHYIKRTSTSKNLQAFCSAALKNYKRDLITLHIKEIKKIEKIKLTTRTADLFFMAYLGRSVGEKYLCHNFTEDYNNKDIILTPEYKKHIHKIIEKYKTQTYSNLMFVKSMYDSLKKSIIYSAI